ncbi:Leucine-rich PPR motif-containing protein, mitochondrial [Chionoecetes opilio]|uniref:Leucine-rich PPR motif-containing protein, mitochondrial n=1 Tax=Chionoecetes opilio TaxID=41210 RepID=A0A8J5CIX1_CHIOP|nr:Leucine-rich PPR motif-containing protein, mitochondrial [Chionoecetes opilio]
MEGSLSLLLLLAARWNDDASIHHLLEQARTAGVRPSAYTMENVLNTYIRRKNLNAAVSLYGRLKREYVEASLESCTVLHLCTMLVESGKCLEALETLREFVQAGKRPEVSPKNAAESCKVLLSKAAETGNYGLVKEMLDHLLLGKLVEPGPQVVAPLLQCKLDRGDVQGTVEVAEHIYRSYNTLPKRMEIFIKLMQHNPPMEDDLLSVLKRGGGQSRDEGDLLGRMFDLAQGCYGPAQAHHDLLFACLESGHPAAARLVLQALAQDTDERLILRMCKIYAKNQREAALEHLLAASKGMTNIDRLKIYEILLDAYKLRGNKMGEEALSLWTSMQEEGLTPSSTFLATLAALLEDSNMKIPSQVQ